MSVAQSQRFRKSNPCPVCGGYGDAARHGQGLRCWGYFTTNGDQALCTRSENAGQLPYNDKAQGYWHKLQGPCGCGLAHSPAPVKAAPKASKGRIVAAYDYGDFEVVRFDPKGFAQRRPDGSWGLGNIKPHLYRRAELLAADPGALVLLPEGEKDTDRLHSLGYVATTNPMGAGKWRGEYSKDLAGRKVVILADADVPGRKHAAQVAAALRPIAASVKLIELPGAKDISDWLDAGHTVQELQAFVDSVPLWTPAPGMPFSENGHHSVDISPLPSAADHAFESSIPTLPSALWDVPVFGMVHEWLKASLESPDAFIFGSTLTLVQQAIGRDVRHYAGRWIYPNDYSLLLGSTAVRKGLAYANLRDSLIAIRVIRLEDWNARIITGFGSAEGLVEAFGEWVEKISGKRKMEVFTSIPERRILNVEEEMGNLLTKMNRPGTANLRDALCGLWDGSDVEPLTRTKRIKAERPFYSVLTMTTPDRLIDGASDLDFSSGLLPRFMFFMGAPKAPLPFPPEPDPLQAEAIAEEMQSIHRHSEALRQRGQGTLALSIEAREMWTGAYGALRQRAGEAQDERTGAMRARVEVHVLKAAMTFAVCNLHYEIEGSDLEIALELGEYLAATADIVAAMKFGHELKRLEDRILRLLEAAGDSWLSVSDIHKHIGGKTPAHQLHQLLQSMVALGMVEVPEGTDPRAPKVIKAKS